MKNKFFMTAHAARTASLDPLQKFRFRVTVAGLPATMGFTTVSGLGLEVGVAEYAEGGYEYTHKLPGKPTVSEITCETGSFSDMSMYNLVKETLTNPDFRQTVIIEHLDRFGNVGRTYKLAEAWASNWEASDLDAESDDVAIDTLTLQFEYYLDDMAMGT